MARGEFSSKLGFILAAAGSAVGLGNIWGFPTQAASNGGAAFLAIYLLLTFSLAYPALMAELIIGRYAKANAVTALRQISRGRFSYLLGSLTGYTGLLTVSLILSFYAIVAGWMVAYFLAPLFELLGQHALATWLMEFSWQRNLLFMVVFMLLTVLIVGAGVRQGIERWSALLMPALLIILLLLISYVLTLPSAMTGVKAYLVPDFRRAVDLSLIVSALGQAFFSLSLGVGTMLIYGSYISKTENLAWLGGAVTLIDIGIAILAGMLILPAMYVAQAGGVEIFDSAGNLLAEDSLIFIVLPALFASMGQVGLIIAAAFFALMIIAALTSSISMLEAPVAYWVENHNVTRRRASLSISAIIMIVSTMIIMNFDWLFGLVVAVTTRYSQPLLGLMFCLFAGWIWHRNAVLEEIKLGFAKVEDSLFWKIWPFYIRYICPAAILAVFMQLIL